MDAPLVHRIGLVGTLGFNGAILRWLPGGWVMVVGIWTHRCAHVPKKMRPRECLAPGGDDRKAAGGNEVPSVVRGGVIPDSETRHNFSI